MTEFEIYRQGLLEGMALTVMLLGIGIVIIGICAAAYDAYKEIKGE